MQEHIQLTQKEINQDLLSGVLGTPPEECEADKHAEAAEASDTNPHH